MDKKMLVITGAAVVLAGCSWLPSVGPDYRRPEVEMPAYDLPDAGLPTTNRTEIG